MTFPIRILLAVSAVAFLASGCSSLGGGGGGRNAPDEFAVVTKAPLTLPPDYALQPPRPGETRPQELSPSERARQLIIGDSSAEPPTDGELTLLRMAGALNADANIRDLLGAENGGLVHKDADLANRILFWRVAGKNIIDEDAPLRVDDPEAWLAARQKSIEKVTGGEQVIIARDEKILNLPGIR